MKLNKRWTFLYRIFLCCLVLVPTSLLAGNQNNVPRFAYIANPYDFTLSHYTIDVDGLMYANGMTFVGDKFPALIVVHPNQRYIYVASRTVDSLRGYEINPLTGDLTEIADSPFDTRLRSPFYGAFHPSGRFLYLAGRGGGVGAFTIDEATGKIGAVPGQPFKSGERTRSLVMHPTGRYLYAANAYNNNISAYNINNTTGVLTQLAHSPISAGEEGPFNNTIRKMPDVTTNRGGLPYSISVHPSGDFVFVANYLAASVSVFRVNQQSGDLQLLGKPVLTGLNPYPNAVHPNGRFLFVGAWGDSDIWVYEINKKTGNLTPVEGSPFATQSTSPVDITISQDGTRLYVSSVSRYDATVFSLNPENGKLELLQLIDSRAGALDIELVYAAKPITVESKYAYVLNHQSEQLVSYSIDSRTGDFKPVARVKTGKNPNDVAHDPKGRTVYVTNGDEDSISIFSIDPKSGKMAPIVGSPYATGQSGISSIAIDANGWYAYVTNRKSNNMSMFLIHSETGELGEARGSPIDVGEQPTKVVVDYFSRFSYVISPAAKQVSAFHYRAANTPTIDGLTQYGSPYMTTDNPAALVTAPDGRFAILVNTDKDNVSVYLMNYLNGALEEIKNGSPMNVGKGPVDLGFDPKGRFVYVANQKSKDISILEKDKVSGELSLVNTVGLPKAPESITIEPSGRYLYVTSKGLKGFMRYAINSENGSLTKKDDVKLGFVPSAISISKVYK